ncbi:Uncharacterised protein [Candidatus Bilamarchaeum dharawalense]|uniref:Uncharacterized protein n=1 Tax=Candidatus Bilamarchaeum dharawalense TaxID=2885759 RepID=A0A5E4LWI0_9ARCH|nr:Uncharacterised protein [Candidatus Bilamarchaeum dharawalense]
MNDVRTAVLRKLAKHGYWGNRHTAFENLHKGFPSHFGNEVKKTATKLIKENFLIPKPTSYGLHVSLNPRMKEIIEKIIGTAEGQNSETKK